MEVNNINKFIESIKESLDHNSFIRLSLSDKRQKSGEIKSISVKVVNIRKGTMLSFVYRYPTKDITKNYSFQESLSLVGELLKNEFFQAELMTTEGDWHLYINRKNSARLKKKTPKSTERPQRSHDKIKQRIISASDNVYLQELGITTVEGKVKNNKQDKYRQINKYIEIIDGIMKNLDFENSFRIVDMGAGKGYLTFALYDYFVNVLKLTPNIIGVEQREELVNQCNRIAQKSSFTNLVFKEGTIQDVELPAIDVLIALHACDTATDDAIYRGIMSNSKVIICAPCCHKQIRKQMKPHNVLSKITQYGILKERQAEIITDGIRSLILEANGYKTKVFEFIPTEHTPKNIIIAGIRRENIKIPEEETLDQIENIKKTYGIDYHYLEKLLEEKGNKSTI